MERERWLQVSLARKLKTNEDSSAGELHKVLVRVEAKRPISHFKVPRSRSELDPPDPPKSRHSQPRRQLKRTQRATRNSGPESDSRRIWMPDYAYKMRSLILLVIWSFCNSSCHSAQFAFIAVQVRATTSLVTIFRNCGNSNRKF